MGAVEELKRAIDTNNLARVRSLMSRDPGLHRAPLGYGKDGPLTWVAECRVPWEPPSRERLAMADWMIGNGSDVHQGGDGPLMRAALNADRIPMMELLVARGADVNASWHGNFPVVFAPCESLDPRALKWLLDHGADPGCGALDYAIGTYARGPRRLAACIEALRAAGAVSKYDAPVVIDLLCGRLDLLERHLDADPRLVHHRFDQLDFGTTAGRALTLRGATLLHVAAEYWLADAARLLLDRGAELDARGGFGQTPLFHAAAQYDDGGLEVVRLLLDRGAGLGVRASLPGDYERPGEMVECTPLGYALRFPGGENQTVALLRVKGAAA
jgi:hypothetical protein